MRPYPGDIQTCADAMRRRWSALLAIRSSRRLPSPPMPGAEDVSIDGERAERPSVAYTRNQELVGLVGVAVGAILLIVASESLDRNAWPSGASGAGAVVFVLGAANLAAAGVFVLLSGLQGRDLTSDRRAVRGVLVKLAGTNMALPAVGLAIYFDGQTSEDSWLMLGALAAYLLSARAGLMWIRRGWKHEMPSADALLAADARAPVLYLRSFLDDDITGAGSLGARVWRSIRSYRHVVSVEQELARVLGRVGPVVAIGRPGESLPELGAARLYRRDDDWRATVSELMRRARLVVVRTGTTPGLQWEIEQAKRLVPPERLIFVSPPATAPRLDVLQERRVLHALLDRSPPLRSIARMKRVGEVALVDHASHHHVIPIVAHFRWRSLWLFAWRPHMESVEFALRRAFERLELPWIEPKSRATAGLLALVFGIFGLHQFYLGNRRRGLWYLAFCWTAIPYLLGWIDLIHLILGGEERFRKQLPPLAAAAMP